jgi:hypothetical protein
MARVLVQNTKQWLNQSCLCNKMPIKTLVTKAHWNFLVSEHIRAPRKCHILIPLGKATKPPYSGLSQTLFFSLFIWQFDLYFYNKTVIIHTVYYYILVIFFQEKSEEIVGTPKFVLEAWGHLDLWLASKMRPLSLTCAVCITQGS